MSLNENFQGNSITHLDSHISERSGDMKDAKIMSLWYEYVQSMHC